MAKFQCEHSPDLETDKDTGFAQRMTVAFNTTNKDKIMVDVAASKGIDPLLSNKEIVESGRC
jgi:hypothetical protein